LALFIAGTPVWYDPLANVRVWPASETDEQAAVEQAAVAFPGSGACPDSPPLERYAVSESSTAGTSSPGLCEDFRRAAAEIESALSRNDNLARTFETASARFESSLGGDGEAAEASAIDRLNLPPWLVETVAAQTAELAVEIDEFMEELTVAREEIDGAAQARGCW
jgi:hypothetical protein